jgi:transcriptional regulator with XRE-family HTH domain
MMSITTQRMTARELEVELGAQVRRVRILQNITQAEVARAAGISVGALKNLEAGRGATVLTLISAVKALGQVDWLNALQPVVSISPMAMLRSSKGRVRARRRPSDS